jgi:hypothetical protein
VVRAQRGMRQLSKRQPIARVRARDLWRGTNGLVRNQGARLFLMALPFGLASVWLDQAILKSYPQGIRDLRVVSIASLYGSMVITYLANAAIAIIALPHIDAAGVAQSTQSGLGLKRLGSVLSIAVLAPLGTISGLAVAVVPGIVAWLSWVIAAPAAAIDGEGPFEAFRHSARLTWGSRRSLFYVYAMVQIMVLVLASTMAVAMGQSVLAPFEDPKPLSPLEAIISGLVETVQIGLCAAICCVAYSKLRLAEKRLAFAVPPV